MLEVGTKAPDFILPDQHGNPVRLSDFLGQKVVLYFYPRDNTQVVPAGPCVWVAYGQLQAKGVVVIGISKDTVTSHEKFAAKHALPFLILSDPEHRVIEAYDVWKEKKLYGKVSMGTVRATYIMDENGVIEAAMPKVKPDTNASEILAYLEKKNAADIQ